nr:formin-like protein 3 [Aegilops tauschii subsp. strangulata]
MLADAEWTAIDATIIRWFFTTISKDLFHTVVSAGDDARALWVKLNGLFTDNQLQRRSIDDYCRRLKTLADELRDIGAKVDDDLLLSTLTAGLNEDFGNTASNLTLMPEPSFPKFVAYLRLEERRMKGVKKRVQHHALAAGTSRGAPPPTAPPAPRHQPPPPAPPGYFPLPPAPPAPPAAPQQPGGGRKQQQAPGGLVSSNSR